MRLETSTVDTCIPSCLAPDPLDPPELAAQREPAALRTVDAPARRAALRRMWRALKLMHAMNEWSELLATGALQARTMQCTMQRTMREWVVRRTTAVLHASVPFRGHAWRPNGRGVRVGRGRGEVGGWRAGAKAEG